MEGQDVRRMIGFAVRAGAFRQGARHYPQAAETMLAAAEVNSARAGTLANRICAEAGRGNGSASARMR